MVFTHSFTLHSLHTYQEIQCTVSNREPYRGDKSLWNFLYSDLAHCVPSINRTFVMSGTLRWIKKKIDVSGKLFYIISDKKCFRRKGLTQLTVCLIQQFSTVSPSTDNNGSHSTCWIKPRRCSSHCCIMRCRHVKGPGTFDVDRVSFMHIQLLPLFLLKCWESTVMLLRSTHWDVYRGHMWPGPVPGGRGSTTLVLSLT